MPGSQSTRPAYALQRPRPAPIVALLALMMILMSACGSDKSEPGDANRAPPTAAGPVPGLTMEEYYGRLQQGFERLRLASENTAPNDLTSTDQLLPFLKDSLAEFSVAMTAFADEVDGLNPPPSLADAHSEFETALRADAESTAELAEKVRQSDSLMEATEAFESRDTTLLRSREPCRALLDIAVQAGITAALPCDE